MRELPPTTQIAAVGDVTIFDTQGAGKGPHLLSWHWTGIPLVLEGQNAVAVEVR